MYLSNTYHSQHFDIGNLNLPDELGDRILFNKADPTRRLEKKYKRNSTGAIQSVYDNAIDLFFSRPKFLVDTFEDDQKIGDVDLETTLSKHNFVSEGINISRLMRVALQFQGKTKSEYLVVQTFNQYDSAQDISGYMKKLGKALETKKVSHLLVLPNDQLVPWLTHNEEVGRKPATAHLVANNRGYLMFLKFSSQEVRKRFK